MIWQLVIGFVVFVVYWKFFRILGYWKRKNVPQENGLPFVGSLAREVFGRVSLPDGARELYERHAGRRFMGMFQFAHPGILVRDPELLKEITVKHFDHFTDHQTLFSPENDSLLGQNLFFLKGQEWKDMRSTLSPVFTSSKLKAMFELMNKCAQQYADFYKGKGEITIQIKDTFSRYATDVIGSTVFGIESDSLRNPKNEFYLAAKKLTDVSGIQALKFTLSNICPGLLNFFKIPLIQKDVAQYYRKLVVGELNRRERSNIVRYDLIYLMLEARKGQLVHEEQKDADMGFATVQESEIGKRKGNVDLSDEMITAQSVIFFFAGFDTVSSGLSFVLYELAVNPDIQKRLQEEVDEVFADGGKLTYDVIAKMKYLDMVVSEALRMWPPAFILDRVCTKPFTLQDKDTGGLPLEKGDLLIVSAFGIHRDPKYYPNPDQFDPERFSDENKGNINPYIYMPFGLGPRACIGSRFALLEIKVLVVHLLSKLDIVVVNKTCIPVKLKKGSFNFDMEEGGWLGLKPREIK